MPSFRTGTIIATQRNSTMVLKLDTERHKNPLMRPHQKNVNSYANSKNYCNTTTQDIHCLEETASKASFAANVTSHSRFERKLVERNMTALQHQHYSKFIKYQRKQDKLPAGSGPARQISEPTKAASALHEQGLQDLRQVIALATHPLFRTVFR